MGAVTLPYLPQYLSHICQEATTQEKEEIKKQRTSFAVHFQKRIKTLSYYSKKCLTTIKEEKGERKNVPSRKRAHTFSHVVNICLV